MKNKITTGEWKTTRETNMKEETRKPKVVSNIFRGFFANNFCFDMLIIWY